MWVFAYAGGVTPAAALAGPATTIFVDMRDLASLIASRDEHGEQLTDREVRAVVSDFQRFTLEGMVERYVDLLTDLVDRPEVERAEVPAR